MGLCDDILWSRRAWLIEECLQTEPSKRISFNDIVSCLLPSLSAEFRSMSYYCAPECQLSAAGDITEPAAMHACQLDDVITVGDNDSDVDWPSVNGSCQRRQRFSASLSDADDATTMPKEPGY